MGDITTPKTGTMSAAAFADTAANTGFNDARPKVSDGGVPFLKMDTGDGEWSFGQEDTAVPNGTVLAVFPNSFASGFAAWKGKTLEAKRMAVVGNPPVREEDLPPVNTQRGWEPSVGVALVITECASSPELEGTMLLYEQTSKGGVEAWNKLFDATMARAKGQHDDFAALVTLDDTSYDHKEWGLVHKPVFKVVGWDDPNALIEDMGTPPLITNKIKDDKNGEDDEVKPASRRRRGGDGARDVTPKDDVEDAEVVGEQPARRRRRRSE